MESDTELPGMWETADLIGGETDTDTFSSNDRAKALMGLRRTDVVAFDQPCELNYWCPVCEYDDVADGEYDERLDWSEYNGFLWCSVCNKDYPSVLCVPLKGEKDPSRPWKYAGIDDAIKVFLDTIQSAKGK